jgi:hypothetical protein
LSPTSFAAMSELTEGQIEFRLLFGVEKIGRRPEGKLGRRSTSCGRPGRANLLFRRPTAAARADDRRHSRAGCAGAAGLTDRVTGMMAPVALTLAGAAEGWQHTASGIPESSR